MKVYTLANLRSVFSEVWIIVAWFRVIIINPKKAVMCKGLDNTNAHNGDISLDVRQITPWIINKFKTLNCVRPTECEYFTPFKTTGVHIGAVGWGNALQPGRSRVRFQIVSLEFFIDVPSGRTMALGSTQPLTEMITRVIFSGIRAAGA